MTYAYTGELLLPVTITPAPATPATGIKAHAEWLVCHDICVPEEADFHLDLPAGTAAPSAAGAAVRRARPAAAAAVAVAGGDRPGWHAAGRRDRS